jgi:hypothetical protein
MGIRAAALVIYSCAGVVLAEPTQVSVLSCSPSRLLPGETATCTVTLSEAAPAGGTEVLLSSTEASLAPSATSVTVPGGTASATFTVTAAPGFAPSLADRTATLTATALHSVFLSWTASASPNLSSYNLYRGTTSGGPYPIVTSVGLSAAYRDSNVQAGGTYYYVVTAVDVAGAESAYSNEAMAALPAAAPQTATLHLCVPGRSGIGVPVRCGAEASPVRGR